VFAIVLIICGLTRAGHFAGLPLVALGAFLLILFAFHSRISGDLGLGKFQVPIISDRRTSDAKDSSPPQATEPTIDRPRSLSEMREAARNPATNRNRRR
jgi:hypothetical protein